jgi:hypothetical protein
MPNQAPNPSFETDLSEWQQASGVAPDMTRVNTQAWHGSWSMEVVSNAAANVLLRSPATATLVTVAPDEVWSVGVYGRWGSGTPKNFRCDLRWMTAGGTESATQPSLPSQVTLSTSEWLQCKVEGAVAPADAVGIRARIAILSTAVDDTFYFDGLQIEKAATLPAFDTGYNSPANLTATPISSSEIDLSWDAVAGATGYDIERDGTVIVTDLAVTTYSDTSLTPSTSYAYRVRTVF